MTAGSYEQLPEPEPLLPQPGWVRHAFEQAPLQVVGQPEPVQVEVIENEHVLQ
jgi:hypothetical protein